MLTKFTPVLAAVALWPAAASAQDSAIVFNEIQYHPADPATQTEWIELRSLSGVDVDVSGWEIDGGVNYVFPEGTVLAGRGHLVVAATPGQLSRAMGPWTGTLDNGGEEVRLRNRNGRVMDAIDYRDDGDWPAGADGSGATLARRSADAAPGPAAWTASAELGGTPGRVNFMEPGGGATPTSIVSIGDPWKYWDAGTAVPDSWRLAGFDDTLWKTGATLIAGGGAALQTLKPTDLPDGLLAAWDFEEAGGVIADNAVPGQPDGTLVNGAALVTDATRGRVAEFDGIDDRMEVIDPATQLPSTVFIPVMTATQDFTWAAWASTGTLSDSGVAGGQTSSVILGNRTSPTGVDTVPREYFRLSPSNVHYGRNNASEVLDFPDLALQTWTHLCVVKRGLTMEFYRNGIFSVKKTLTGGQTNPLTFYIGGDRKLVTPLPEHFKGRVDDAGLWTRALTPAEITQLGSITAGAPPLPTPPEQTTALVTGPEPRYFRRTFTFSGTPVPSSISLWPIADDGAVIYLNGVEIWRANVPATTEIGSAHFAPARVPVPDGLLLAGTNVLAAEVHQFSGGSPDLLFGAALDATVTPLPRPDTAPSVVFSEIGGVADGSFFVELRNVSATPVDLAGWTIGTNTNATLELPAQGLAPGAWLVVPTKAALNFAPAAGMRLFLLGPGGRELHDARSITGRVNALTADGRWDHPSVPTPGAANAFPPNDAIVINEIMYAAPGGSPEQWIELYNRSGAPVDLGGWHFTDGIGYTFPENTPLGAGEHALVVWDVAAFNALHPGLPRVYGPFSGGLSGRGDRLRLRDAADTLADEVGYKSEGRWPQFTKGGGSSLELKSPDADNSLPEAWAESNETARGGWTPVSYEFLGTNPEGAPTFYHELVMGLVNDGEALIDDISVIEDPAGAAPLELIKNGTFSSGATEKWRLIGNHRTSTVVDDPDAPGNPVLKIVATGYTEHMSNHCETTLQNGTTIPRVTSTSKKYRISYRARWLKGSNRLHTRLYFNRGAHQEVLPMPSTGGTPGAKNSTWVAQLGPSFTELTHTPAVPPANQPATISVRLADRDGVAGATLQYAVNGGAFVPLPMTAGSDGVYSAVVPGQAASAKVQFYIEARDVAGAVSTFPAAGPDSRAMIPWDDGRAFITLPSGAQPHHVRIVMTAADTTAMHAATNVMSNEYRPCTVIYDEREIYYHCRVHLKSSEHGRAKPERVGFFLVFSPDQLFLGVHDTIAIDRSGAGDQFSQKEILVKHTMNRAGGIPCTEDDLIRVIAPQAAQTGPAILVKTKLDSDSFLDGQFDHGSDGTLFEYELLYPLSSTQGGVEGLKLTQDSPGPGGAPVRKLSPGLSKEEYRWFWLIKNNRNADDYTGQIALLTTLGASSSPTFISNTNALMDVDQWLRAWAGQIAWGVGDNYASGSQHNALFYVRPNGKAMYFPWDMDFTASAGATDPVTTNTELGKLIATAGGPGAAANKRLYYGHLLSLCDTSFNIGYLDRWMTHYSTFLYKTATSFENLSTFAPFVTQREAFIRTTVKAAVPVTPFAITSNGGADYAEPNPTTALTGNGWVDVVKIRLAGNPESLAVTWTSQSAWRIDLPVSPGPNRFTLEAVNSLGQIVGTQTITVTGTGTIVPAGPDNLVVSELHYHPSAPSAPEIAAGFASDDDFEFIELQNIGPAPVDLTGCRFDTGITYSFASGTRIGAGERLVVPRRASAFALRHPGVATAAEYYQALDPTGNQFSNGGESIALLSAANLDVKRFSYDDAAPWPTDADGGGRTLVLISPRANPDHDDPLSWRASAADGGTPGGPEGVTFTGGATDDVNFDGLPDLVNFAVGTGSQPTLMSSPIGNGIVLTVDRDTLSQASFVIESGTSLTAGGSGSWQTVPNPILISRTPVAGMVERLTFVFPSSPLPPSSQAFVRVRFESP